MIEILCYFCFDFQITSVLELHFETFLASTVSRICTWDPIHIFGYFMDFYSPKNYIKKHEVKFLRSINLYFSRHERTQVCAKKASAINIFTDAVYTNGGIINFPR